MPSTEAILNRHLEASGNQDVDALLADYADDAIVISEGDVYRGRSEIRSHYEELFDRLAGGDGGEDETGDFSLLRQVVEDDYITFSYRMETPDAVWEFATDTIVVEDGQIAAHISDAKVTSK